MPDQPPVAVPGPASVSPADTIWRFLNALAGDPCASYPSLGAVSQALAALLAVGERDRRQIARLTEALERLRGGLEAIASEPPDRGLTPDFREFARAVLAGEEDAGDG